MSAERMPGACTPGPDGSCSLCGDEAVSGRVLSVDARAGTAEVALAGAVAAVALDLVDGVRIGDTVLVHQGFAIARVDAPGEAG
jgi:hydrogenase maturation factor